MKVQKTAREETKKTDARERKTERLCVFSETKPTDN